MPMSATGCSNSALQALRISGFTLIEILVAMAIVGVLATSVVLTLPDNGLSQGRASVRGWQILAETAALRAEAQAQPYAWEITERQAGLWVLEGNQWRAPAQAATNNVGLAEGLAVNQPGSAG